MSDGNFPLVVVSGSAYEMGLQHGRACEAKINRFIELTLEGLRRKLDLSNDRILSRAADYLDCVANDTPHLSEEMQGIARGAGRRHEEIALLHVRSLLIQGAVVDGCTAFAVTTPATAEGATYLGQNDDWSPELEDLCVMLLLRPTRGPTILTYCYAGTVGQKGINSSGLGLCGTMLASPTTRIGLPNYVVARHLLEQFSITDAVSTLTSLRRATAINFVLAQGTQIVDVETTPTDLELLHPHNGILVHTNHYEHARFVPQERNLAKMPDSRDRYFRMTSLLEHARGRIDRPYLQTILADHDGYPTSICRHDHNASDGLESIAGFVAEPGQGVMYVARGNPCEAIFARYTLSN